MGQNYKVKMLSFINLKKKIHFRQIIVVFRHNIMITCIIGKIMKLGKKRI